MLATLLVPLALAAKPLPPDAARTPTIARGTPFEIVALHREDAYYRSDRKTIPGVACVADEALTLNDPAGYYGGPATCDDGSRYFFMVALRVTGAPVALPEPESGAEPIAEAGATASAQPFVVTAIDPEDAYFSASADLIGQVCVSGAEGLHANAPGWYGGSARCQDGVERYFYKAAIETTFAPIADGAAFKIVDVHAADAYADTRDALVGRDCVANGALSPTDGWYSGAATCGADTFVFFKIAATTGERPVGAPTASDVPPVAAPDRIAAGSAVIIRGIAPDDAYVADADTIVGASCVATDDLYPDAGWMTGGVTCPGVGEYYFFHVALEVVGGPSGDLGDRYQGPAVRAGTEVRIVDLADTDGWSFREQELVGQDCKVKKTLTATGDGWYQGLLVCSGARLAFTQVAVSLR